jgi:ketosteroid isomerase-like protein
MKKSLIALALAVCTAALATASAQTSAAANAAVMKPVHQFLDGFNKGDTKTMLAAGADQMSILDEFPPHEWHGPGAFAKWMSDYDADAAKNGITDGIVTFGQPSHVDVTGDHAYVVMPADYKFKQHGKPEGEVGSIITITLQNGPDGWRINGWAWAKH